MKLTAEQFPAFFAAIHGTDPFPWQARLARQVIESGAWPALLDLPTGAGKTAALDVATFALAVDPARAPRRTVFVVDRRLVVDQARQRALLIANRIAAAEDPVLEEVRARLAALSGVAERPLAVAALRGGVPRDDGWSRRPDQPCLVTSTVDQVGSRLLFRGYGVGDRMLPVHAGLLGHDTLFLLDEVHLSEPFAQTLEQVRRYRCMAPRALPGRWGVVRMSATPGAQETTFSLDAKDRAHAVLRQRLNARKPTDLCKRVEVGGGDEDSRRGRFAAACADEARRLIDSGLRTVLVVVNRVDTARQASERLRATTGMDVRLITGRMRPIDKDRVSAELVARIGAGADRSGDRPPLVVVATQCVEAGADFDVEGLVTECASLDALRQRFGRLNRRGEHDATARGKILIRADQAKSSDEDPVYGGSLAATWRWLEGCGEGLDFGISALELPADQGELIPPRAHAPVLLPTHLDLWAQTAPRPRPDPVVGHWLHGAGRDAAEVQVVWRADLTESALLPPSDGRPAVEAVAMCPPGSIEALSLPLHAVRAWLEEESVPQGSDVEGEAQPDREERRRRPVRSRRALRWKGETESELVEAPDIHPGDTLVVPAEYGGLSEGCWDPTDAAPVRDLGDLVQWRQRGRPTLRLDPRVLRPWGVDTTSIGSPVDDDPDLDLDDQVDAGLAALGAQTLPQDAIWISRAAARLSRRRRRRPQLVVDQVGSHPIVASRFIEPMLDPACGEETEEVSTEDEASSFACVEIPLVRHSKDVEAHALGFASRCGLDEVLVSDLALAGYLHDLGKADPRFQRMLCGGSEVETAMLEAPLAKSAIPAWDRRARLRAQRRAGYPPGTRHELMSLALISDVAAIRARAHDWELVLHLVASHHGWCRPLPPAVQDATGPQVEHALDLGDGRHVQLRASAAHELARVDSGIPDRFWSLVRRYGWFGLAYLEALLRLADHRASAEEQGRVEVVS